VLFAAVDAERNTQVTPLLKAALQHLVLEAAPAAPGPWLTLLCSVLLGAPEWRQQAREGDAPQAEGEGGDEDESPPMTPHAADGCGASGAAEVQAVDQVRG